MSTQTTDAAKQIVEKALVAVGDIATLPQVTLKIIQIVEDPKSTARDLHDVIKNDPALSAKVLKVVNSAFYGLPGQVASMDRAIVLLGLAAVKNIAIAASIARLFKGPQISEHFNAADLWRHSIAVAVAARNFAKFTSRVGVPDEVFVAGLIHDIGTLVERQVFPNEFAEVVDRCMTHSADFLESEREVIGADHQAFGVGLTTKWKFPRHLRAAVGFHHNPDALSDELKLIGLLVQLADVVCCQEKLGFYLTAQNGTITEPMLEALGLSMDDVENVRAALPEELKDAEASFGN